MMFLRALIRDHRTLALLALAMALCVKLLVPSGYMIGGSSKILTVQICNDGLGLIETRQITIPLDAGSHQTEHGKTDSGCGYSTLSMASLAGADAPLLAVLLAFIIALGFLVRAPARLVRASYLRPPLRGPPAAA